MPARSPIDISNATLRFTIKINGSVIKDYYPVVRIHIHHEINRISTAEIVVIGGTIESEDLPISNGIDFFPGNTIEIQAGYIENNEETIFKGIIIKQAVRLEPDSGFNLVVYCKHKAVLMTFNRTEKTFENTTDSDIMSGIIGNYGITAAIDKTNIQQEITYQKSATDWDFILSRAEFYGYVTILDEQDIRIGKPVFDGEPLLQITAGDSIISFQAELDAEKQPASLKASAWDPDHQQPISSNAAEPSVNVQGNTDAKNLSEKLKQSELFISSVIPMAQEELKAWADGKLLMMRMNSIKGYVTFMGNADVKVGKLVELAGVGDRFNGKAYVSSVTHTIEDGSWTTKVKFGLGYKPIHKQPDFSYPAATGQLPVIHGLQIGVVTKLFSDETASKNKILVHLPSNTENPNNLWARVSNFYATAGSGAYFLPEVGDEVVIGFLESDPRFPIVLGSLYSNSRKSAVEPQDNNNYIKSFTTKGNLKIIFDDEQKITTIETPEGNSITLNDKEGLIEMKDQNKNSVKMNTDGIQIDSKKDIVIKAAANMTLEASGKLKLSAIQDVEVAGANIKNEAKAGFTAKGNTGAELLASGKTVVKGGIVMIN